MSRPIELTAVPGRSRWASLATRGGRPSIVMALWGLAGAAATVLVLLMITPKVWPMEDWRGIHLRAEVAVWLHGGPLLVGREGAHGAYYPVDFGDDEGVFVYIPLLSRLFGVSDPVSMVRDVYVALLSLAMLIYPTIFYRLTRSRVAGLVAPAMFLVCMLSLGFVDVYWIPAWGALVLFPLIFLLARDWPRRFGLPAIMAIALAASWLSSVRSYTGLGIAVAAAIVLMLRRWPWWRLVPALAVLAVVYISINAFVFSAIRSDRDRRLGAAAKTVNITAAHAFWGEAYEGIGYLHNKYDLYYEDAVPNQRVQHDAPGTVRLSSHYETVIRKAYFQFAGEHPLEMVRQYAAKALVVVADTTPYLLVIILTLPSMLLLGPDRRIVRRWVLLTVPAVLLAFLSPMLALPRQWYEEDLYGVLGVIGILGACWMLKRVTAPRSKAGGVRAAMNGTRLSWVALLRSPAPGWRSVRIAVVAVLLLCVIGLGGAIVREESNRWQHGSAGVLMEHLGG